MRDIKFRGFSKDDNDWHYGSLVQDFDRSKFDENGKRPDYYQIYSKITEWHVVENESIGQFTGLTDKNGIEIYEGDIIQDFFKSTREVVFYKGAFGYAIDNSLVYLHSLPYCKVVGNIHQNPELLK